MNYENRILIFIDILGFKDHINNSVNDPSYIKIIDDLFEDLHNHIDNCINQSKMGDIIPKSLIITSFSDSIVISYNADEFSSFFNVTYAVAKFINVKAVEKGFLLRGAIVDGKLIHNEKRIFGPALVKAYTLETSVALYPRIIVPPEILSKRLRTDSIDERLVRQFPDNIVYKDDQDRVGYIDYLSNVNGILQNDPEVITNYYGNLKKMIEAGLQNQDEIIRKKYSWVNEKFEASKEVIQLQKEGKL